MNSLDQQTNKMLLLLYKAYNGAKKKEANGEEEATKMDVESLHTYHAQANLTKKRQERKKEHYIRKSTIPLSLSQDFSSCRLLLLWL
jgi:acyl-CoA-binding protein